MKIVFYNETAFNTFYDWTVADKKIAKKIAALIKDISRTPYDGIGKPEALKHELSGWYSRRINDEHRLIYKVENDTLTILSCKDHYE
ncbi:MAG: Txe/YoeB family addiction module toxin [Spirochaetaceae bacterium]|jgi:toxin YoeB|nr:Txe/YoeB family addiction module toxin [Spirochaetaceae bacterium]